MKAQEKILALNKLFDVMEAKSKQILKAHPNLDKNVAKKFKNKIECFTNGCRDDLKHIARGYENDNVV